MLPIVTGFRRKDQYAPCSLPGCLNDSTDQHDIAICHNHLLLAWSLIQGELVDANPKKVAAQAEGGLIEGLLEGHVRTEKPGTIYYLQIDTYIKIGYTKNLYRRIRQYPPNAILLAQHDGTPDDEKRLHQDFAAYLDSGREWFRDVPELRNHIKAVVAQHGQPKDTRRKPSGQPIRPKATYKTFSR